MSSQNFPRQPLYRLIIQSRNGDLKEYIASGVTKEEFSRRLGVVFEISAPSDTSSHNTPPTTAAQEPPTTQLPQANGIPTAALPSPAGSPAVEEMLIQRAARLKIEKREKDAAEKAKRIDEAKARKVALKEESPVSSQKSADMKYALMQKKRQQEARAERERILKRVEDDKAERREREIQRKAQAKAKEDAEEGKAESASPSSIRVPPSINKFTQCAVQVRLFDGSTIRSRFPSDGSLRADVRPWIDKQQIEDAPYTFKLVLTPLSNKNISISDEEHSLHSQGLIPSATLILIPVEGYTSAYKDGASRGIISRVASSGYGLVSSGVGLVSGILGTFIGGGRGGAVAPAPLESPANSPPTDPNPAINVRTLRDHYPDDQQFYNGNAVSFAILDCASTNRCAAQL